MAVFFLQYHFSIGCQSHYGCTVFDGNFIEVKVGDTYNVFKVTDAIKSKLQSKNMGDKITFTYVSSAGQNLITSIN